MGQNLGADRLHSIPIRHAIRIVAGPEMEQLIRDFINDVLTERGRRRWAEEYLRRLAARDAGREP